MKKRLPLFVLLCLPLLAVLLLLQQPDSGPASFQSADSSGAASPERPEPVGSEAGGGLADAATDARAALVAAAAEVAAGEVLLAFVEWTERYLAEESPEARAALIEEGVAIAAARRQVMRQLIQEDPEAALRNAIPWSVRAELPDDVVALLEERVNARGNFDVYGIAPREGEPLPARPVLRYFRTETEEFEVFVYGSRLADRTSPGISMHGIEIDGMMAAQEDSVRVLEAGEPVDPSKEFVFLTCPVSGRSAPETLTHAPLAMEAGIVASSGDKNYYLCTVAHLTAAQEDEGDSGPRFASTYETHGPKDVLVIRVNFDWDIDEDAVDDEGEPILPPEPIGAEEALETMLAISDHFRASSFQEFSFRVIHVNAEAYNLGDPTDYFNPANDTSNAGLLMERAREEAREEGFESHYHFVIVTFPDIGFPWGGLGRVGAKGSWVQGGLGRKVTVHELGHNLGLWHARYWEPAGPNRDYPNEAAFSAEYGNPFDMMGGAPFPNGHFSSNFKSILNWLPEPFIHTVPSADSTATYRVHRLDGGARLRDPNRYAIRLRAEPHRTLPQYPQKDYWIDFRQLGNDPESRLMTGVAVQWGDGGNGSGGTSNGSHLLQLSRPTWPSASRDAPLVIGETFSDQILNIHITPKAKGGFAPHEYIDVTVTRGLLKVEITDPMSDPSVIDPIGVVEIFEGPPFAFTATVEVSASPVREVRFFMDGQPMGTAQPVPGSSDYRLAIDTTGHVDPNTGVREVKEVVAVVTNEAGNVVVSDPVPVRFLPMPLEIELHASPSSVFLGESILLSVVQVGQGEPLQAVELFANGDLLGALVGDAESGFELNWTPSASGIFTVEATGYGGEGGLAAAVPVEVIVTEDNSDVFFTVSPEVAVLGGMVALEAGLQGRQQDVASVRFHSDHGELGLVDSAPFELAWEFSLVGLQRLWAVIEDQDGAHLMSLVVDVNVARPVLSVTLSPRNAMPGEAITFSAEANLPWWEPVEVEYWIDDGLHTVRESFAPVSFVPPEAGIFRVEVRARDALGNEAISAVATFGAQETLGLAWSERDPAVHRDLLGGAVDGERVVLAGIDGVVRVSDDGIGWWSANLPSGGAIRGVAYGAGLFVAVGDGGRIVTSEQGEIWQERASGVTTRLMSVGFHQDVFLAVGELGVILRSTDGMEWETIDSPVTATLRQSAYGFGQWIIVGDSGTILTSATQTGWVVHTPVTNLDLRGVAYGKGTFVVVGGRPLSLVESEGVTLVSFDAENWELELRSEMLHSAMFAHHSFVATGFGGTLLTSFDGVHWNRATAGTLNSFFGVVSYSGGFLSFGKWGTLRQSEPVDTRPATYARWLLLHLNSLELGDDDLTAPGARPDGRVANLLRYAMGLQPGIAVAPEELPHWVLRETGGEEQLGLRFRRSVAATDILMVGEVSKNLMDWMPLEPESAVEAVDGGDYQWVIVVDETSGLEPRGFLRLNVRLLD